MGFEAYFHFSDQGVGGSSWPRLNGEGYTREEAIGDLVIKWNRLIKKVTRENDTLS